jgi:glycosyltransferase involved in cell wall biosynthesis
MIFSKREALSVAQAGVTTRRFFVETRTRPVVLAREWRRLRRELKAFKPHIVHAHYGTVTACLCALASSTPLVMTLHNAELNHELDVSFLREKCGHLLSQLAALKASRIVCVNTELQRKLWWHRNRVTIIPSSVNLEHFRPAPRAEARAALNWDPSEPVVLFYAGRNPRTKRLDLALDVTARARAIHGPFRLEILRWQVDPDRIPLYLNAADCLLCTSSAEGSPTIVKEAMACNLPVVSVDVGDVRERIERLDNCHIRTSVPDDLAGALVSVLRSRRRSNGRMAAAAVSTEACRNRLLSVYERLLEETGTVGGY